MSDWVRPLFLDGGGDPSFADIDAFLRTHFNARAVREGAAVDGTAKELHDYVPYPHVAGPQRIYCRTCGNVINIERGGAL